MILKQYYLGCLAHASYLLGDEESGTAIVVDPQRDIQQYLADAEKFGLQIHHVFLSHFHADFVAGHLELRDSCGATIHLGARAKAEYEFVAMKDGDTLDFPGLRLQVLETPGTPSDSFPYLALTAAKMRPYPTRFSPAIRFLSAMWAARTCAHRLAGARTISAPSSSIPSTT